MLEPKNRGLRDMYAKTQEIIKKGKSKWVEGMSKAMTSDKYRQMIKQDENDQLLRDKSE